MDNVLDIAIQLLSFKNGVIKVYNGYSHQKGVAKDRSKSIKGKKYNKALSQELPKTAKTRWTRDTWIAFRNNNSATPPPPVNLTA